MEKEKVIEFIEKLNIGYDTDSYDIRDTMRKLGLDVNNYSIQSGSSKYCIIFKKEDFVVKWTSGKRHQDKEKNEAYRESVLYELAVQENLQCFFPKTHFLTQSNGIYFIMQEKIDEAVADTDFDTDERYRKISKTASNKIIKKVKSAMLLGNLQCRREVDSLWISMAIILYGKKAVKRLCEFIRTYNINDLHGNNIGYKNNKPIILDFSGYFR